MLLSKAAILCLALLSFSVTEHAVSKTQFSQQDLHCLSLNIHHEARGEPLKGKIAVAHVTLNRIKNKAFPKDVCHVVKQPGQFSWINDRNWKAHVPISTVEVAYNVLSGKYKDVSNGALYFHNKDVPGFNRRVVASIGQHIFYQ